MTAQSGLGFSGIVAIQIPDDGATGEVLTKLTPDDYDYDWQAGGGGGAPDNAEYVVLSLDATLTNERVLTAGSGISIVDGGANGPVTINATSGGATISAEYRFQTSLVEADPGNGNFRMDNATPASVTELYISSTDDNNNDFDNFLSFLEAGAQIYIQQDNDGTKFILFDVDATIDNTGWWTIQGSIDSSGTIFDNNGRCTIVLLYQGTATSIVGPSTTPQTVLTGDGAGGWTEELSATIDGFGVFSGGGVISSGPVSIDNGGDTWTNIFAGNVLLSVLGGTATHQEVSGEIRWVDDLYHTERAAAGGSFIALGQFWVRDDFPNTPMFTDNAGNDLELIGASAAGAAQEVAVFNSANQIEGNDNFQFDDSVTSGRVEIKCVDNVINEIGLFLIDPNSVLNPDGWQWCTGQAGLFDGALILSHKPADVINNRDVTYLPGARPTFGFGIAVASNTSLGSEQAGALAYFMPQDVNGREETKISFVGEVGGTGHEGVFSIEGFAYGDAGLQFARLAHYVIDADYKRHIDLFAKVVIGSLGVDEATESGDNAAIGYTTVNGLEVMGQGTSRDVTILDDTHQITLSSQTGTSAWRFHKRFQVGTYVEFHMNSATDDFEITGAGACDNILWTGYDGFFSIDSDLVVEGNGSYGPGTGSVTLDIDSGSADFLSGQIRFLAAGVLQASIQWFEFAAGGDSLLINSATGKMQLFTNNILAMEIATDQSIRYAGTQEWDKGANIASAATLVLGTDGNSFTVTGTTTITALSAKPIGTVIILQFAAAVTLEYDATALDLSGDVDMVTEADDTLGLYCYDGTNWREIFRTDGQNVRVSGSIADQSMVRGNGGAKRVQDTGNLIGDDDEIIMAGFIQYPTFTDAELNAIANAVNTTGAKVQGAQAYNSTQDVPIWAVGAADGSVWVDGAGTTVNTPV